MWRENVLSERGWYINRTVNWEDTWVKGAWLTWKGGPTLKHAVSPNEFPLCRIGNGGGPARLPGW